MRASLLPEVYVSISFYLSKSITPGVRVAFGHDATLDRLRRWEGDLAAHGTA
jgi:hypothetical protein